MKKMRMMSVLYASLIGIGLVLIQVPQAAAGKAASPPSWSQQINDASRFTVLAAFGGAAVLDKETGLVWEQSPDTTTRNWLSAHSHCNTLTVGGRKGWRLPMVQELASLIDPNNPGGNPDLPPGHPFSNVQSNNYWSATADADVASFAWLVASYNGDVGSDGKTGPNYVWCVRGGQGADLQ